MKASVTIDAGVCGFQTHASVTSEDQQNAAFEVSSDFEKISTLACELKTAGAIDAYQEISPAGQSILLQTSRKHLKGCCAGCAVPVGLFKAMQVAAGLVLPKDIRINLGKE